MLIKNEPRNVWQWTTMDVFTEGRPVSKDVIIYNVEHNYMLVTTDGYRQAKFLSKVSYILVDLCLDNATF